ncbi:hypothetical protein DL95DRAFT_305056, partial [Leptodontidium sp. 2 PMI_412]
YCLYNSVSYGDIVACDIEWFHWSCVGIKSEPQGLWYYPDCTNDRQKKETRCLLYSHAPFKDLSSLCKHITAAYTRPFPCIFTFAGCNKAFGSKNEWKRHIVNEYFRLTYYRCSACPQIGVGDKTFSRKDLFT